MATIPCLHTLRNIHVANGQYPSDIQYHRDVPLIMKLRFQLVILVLACSALLGCHGRQPPIIRELLVGSYVYKSEDPEGSPTDHTWDHLTLRADGGYDLVQGGPTKPKSETVGVWTLWSGRASGPEVLLDRGGYPIEVNGDDVRLLIDTDVGIWYEKAR